MGDSIRTKKDLMQYLERMAKEYAPLCEYSVKRNTHMNDLVNTEEPIRKDVIDAILVDFVNCIGNDQGLDWGLKTKDLYE